jgi:hypothetical protein
MKRLALPITAALIVSQSIAQAEFRQIDLTIFGMD